MSQLTAAAATETSGTEVSSTAAATTTETSGTDVGSTAAATTETSGTKGGSDAALLPPPQTVNLFLRPVGDAPALKKAKYRLDGKKCLLDVERFLKKNIGTNQSLFLYCGSGFAPTPNQNLQDLYDCFQVGGELVITYGLQEAWG